MMLFGFKFRVCVFGLIFGLFFCLNFCFGFQFVLLGAVVFLRFMFRVWAHDFGFGLAFGLTLAIYGSLFDLIFLICGSLFFAPLDFFWFI